MSYRIPSAEILRELSDSRYTVYDVLPSFFLHADHVVTLGQFCFSSFTISVIRRSFRSCIRGLCPPRLPRLLATVD